MFVRFNLPDSLVAKSIMGLWVRTITITLMFAATSLLMGIGTEWVAIRYVPGRHEYALISPTVQLLFLMTALGSHLLGFLGVGGEHLRG